MKRLIKSSSTDGSTGEKVLKSAVCSCSSAMAVVPCHGYNCVHRINMVILNVALFGFKKINFV